MLQTNINENKMTPEQFVYWLQGFCEMTEVEPSSEQWKMIREHLAEVFKKETNLTFTTTATEQPPYIQPSNPMPFQNPGQTFIC